MGIDRQDMTTSVSYSTLTLKVIIVQEKFIGRTF